MKIIRLSQIIRDPLRLALDLQAAKLWANEDEDVEVLRLALDLQAAKLLR